MPAKSTPADLGMLVDQLLKLGLDFAAEALPAILTRAVKEDLGTPALLEQLLCGELERREERRIRTSLRLSGLPTGQTLANFDFAFQPAVQRSKLEALATCAWLREKQGLLILGPPGVGKTHLAVSLGVQAVECGFLVAFFRLEELLHAMRKDAEVPPTRLKGKKYMKAALVIIDEVGFETFSRQEANLFFRLVSYRYQRGSLCITSNKVVKDWPEMLAGDEVITTAILDRLLHSCHVLNIRGRSYRLRDLEDDLNGRSRGVKGAPMWRPRRSVPDVGRRVRVRMSRFRRPRSWRNPMLERSGTGNDRDRSLCPPVGPGRIRQDPQRDDRSPRGRRDSGVVPEETAPRRETRAA